MNRPHALRPAHATAVRGVVRTLVAAALLLCLAALPAAAADGKVNINDADAATLQLLPRVGPALAQRIIEHRETNGKFAEPTDLMQVRGIGERTFELMEPYVATEGESTLDEKVRGSSDAEPEGDGADGSGGAR